MKHLVKIIVLCVGITTVLSQMAFAAVDYKSRLESVLDERPRIFFEPEIAEYILQTSFLGLEYDTKRAAKIYDEIAGANGGGMSVDDLFFVCMVAHKMSQKEMFSKDERRKIWPVCVQEFIAPLLSTAKDTAIMDDYLVEFYDGTLQNQPCTPPQVDSTVLNMICTSGKYSFDPAFEKAMITKFRTEGGCANVQDGNGTTCFGVAGRYYPQVYRTDPPFTRAEAEDIAYENYYKKYDIDRLPDAIRGDVFMALWGTGKPGTSIGLLQNVLGVPETNKVDDATIMAARNYNGGKGNLRKKFLKARWARMKNNNNFSNGWAKAFLVYMKNGCHTITTDPLERNAETVAECDNHL